MSELIYPSEVIPEIDWENPLADKIWDIAHYSSSRISPDNTTVTPLLKDDEPYVYPNAFQQNGDGSISSLTTNASSFLQNLPPKEYILFRKHSILLVLDVKVHSGNIGNQTGAICGFGGYGNNFLIKSGGYSAGLVLSANSQYSAPVDAGVNNYIVSQDGKRHLIVAHYDHRTGRIKAYVDTILVFDKAFSSISNGAMLSQPKALMPYVSSDPASSKLFYAATLVSEDGFSLDEVEALANNPYQLLKKEVETEQEFALNFDDGKKYVDLRQLPILKSFEAEVEFTPSASTLSYARLMRLNDVTISLAESGRRFIRVEATRSTHSTGFVSSEDLNYDGSTSYKVRVKVDDGASGYRTVYLWINDVFIGESYSTESDTSRSSYNDHNGLGAYINEGRGGFEYKGSIKSLRISGTDFDNEPQAHFFEFNQSRGKYVKDHYSRAIATLVGFPEHSGYVRAWGVSDGLLVDAKNNSNAVNININEADNVSWELELEIQGVEVGSFGYYRLLTSGTTANRLIINANGSNCSLNLGGLGNSWDIGTDVKLNSANLKWVADGLGGLALYLNGVLLAGSKTGVNTAITFVQFGADGSGSYKSSQIVKKIGFTSTTNTANSRYYDFTKIKGNSLVVPETLNGQDGTMVGFPENGVFVPEKTKVLVGQEFDDTNSFLRGSELIDCRILDGKFHFEIELLSAIPIATANVFTLRTTIGGSTNHNIIGLYSTGSYLNCYIGGVSRVLLTIADHPDARLYRGEYDKTLNTFKFYVNGAEVFSGNADDTGYRGVDEGYLRLFTNESEATVSNFGTTVKRIEFYNDYHDTTTTLDFTQEAGNAIVDTSGNENHGTVVGGELKRIYEYGGYGELVGYQFPVSAWAKITIPTWTFRGDFTFEFHGIMTTSAQRWFLGTTGSDSLIYKASNNTFVVKIGGVSVLSKNYFYGTKVVKLRISRVDSLINLYINDEIQTESGTSTEPVVVTEIYYNALVTKDKNSLVTNMNQPVLRDDSEPTNNRNYDFTTGDETKIVETIQGNHALISNDSTVGFQPIVPVEVFTVGAGKDYTLIADFFTARKSQPDATQRAIIYESDAGTNTLYVNGSTKRMELIAAKGFEFDGTSNPPIDYMARRTYCYGTVYHVDGIGINLFNGSGFTAVNAYIQGDVQSQNKGFTWSIKDSLIHSLFINIGHQKIDVNIANSIFEAGRTSTIATTTDNNITTNVTDSVFPSGAKINGYNVGAYATAGTVTHVINSIFEGSIPSYSSTVGSTGNVDMTTVPWFTDAPNKDYTLTQAGQDATKGKGYLGSDLVTWAYAESISPVSGVTIDFDSLVSTSTLNAYSAITSTTLSADSSSSTSTLGKAVIAPSVIMAFDDLVSVSTTERTAITTNANISLSPASSTSTLNNFGYSVSVTCSFDPVASSSLVDLFQIDAGVSPTVYFDSVLSYSALSKVAIGTSTTVGLQPVYSASTLSNPDLSVFTTLTFNQVGSASNADQVPLIITTTLSYDPIQSSASLGQFNVTSEPVINLNSVSSTSDVGGFVLSVDLGHFELSSVAFEFNAGSLCCFDLSEDIYQAVATEDGFQIESTTP